MLNCVLSSLTGIQAKEWILIHLLSYVLAQCLPESMLQTLGLQRSHVLLLWTLTLVMRALEDKIHLATRGCSKIGGVGRVLTSKCLNAERERERGIAQVCNMMQKLSKLSVTPQFSGLSVKCINSRWDSLWRTNSVSWLMWTKVWLICSFWSWCWYWY